MDGGYPAGIAGQDISELGRILAVADYAISLADSRLMRAHILLRLSRDLSGWHRCLALFCPDAVRRLETPEEWQYLQSEAPFTTRAAAVFDTPERRPQGQCESAEVWARQLGILADRFHPLVPNHAQRVSALSGAIARERGWGTEEVESVVCAALLAEVGRIALPAPLVFRLGGFTEHERALLRAYPALSQILRPIEPYTSIFSGSGDHQETLDGCGYPEGFAESRFLLEVG